MTAGNRNAAVGTVSPGSPSLTVSAGMACGLIAFATQHGADRAALMAAAGLPSDALTDEDSRVPFDRYVKLYSAAEDLCGDPAFALHLGEWLDGMDLLVCHVGSASATLGDALIAINRYGRLAIDLETVGGGDQFQLQPSTEGTWLIDASVYPDNASQLTETSFMRLVAGTRQLTQRQFVRAVHLVRSEPSHRGEYERVFRAPVWFSQTRNAMLMDPEWFSLQLPATSPYADSVLEAHAKRLMKTLAPAQRCRQAVSQLVAARLGGGNLTMAGVARELGKSRQTLYRALRAEGATFEKVVDDVRRDLALRLLVEGRSIAETAERLGFSDRSAFTRAFKRWTGMSPSRSRPPALDEANSSRLTSFESTCFDNPANDGGI